MPISRNGKFSRKFKSMSGLRFSRKENRHFRSCDISIYREVREEFRERWSDYYAARNGRRRRCHARGPQGRTRRRSKGRARSAARRGLSGTARNARRSYREMLADQRDIRRGLRGPRKPGSTMRCSSSWSRDRQSRQGRERRLRRSCGCCLTARQSTKATRGTSTPAFGRHSLPGTREPA